MVSYISEWNVQRIVREVYSLVFILCFGLAVLLPSFHNIMHEMKKPVPAFLWTKYYQLTHHAVPIQAAVKVSG